MPLDEDTAALRVEVKWFDDDLVELEIAASNGQFAGRANLYEKLEAAQEASALLRGFPARADDRRVIGWGNFDPNNGGGGARLDFECLDRAAHAVVFVTLRADPHGSAVYREQTVSLTLRCEASAVDQFVEELRAMRLTKGSSAVLRAEPSSQ